MKRLKPRLAVHDTWDIDIVTAPYARAGVEVLRIGNLAEARTFDFNFLLLPGGADINPIYYGEAPIHASLSEQSKLRDRVEWILLRRALGARIPTLGICRGMQYMAVAAGAPLVQDLVAMGYTDQNHRFGHHLVEFKNKKLENITGSDMVNTFHHQGVANTPLGWKTAAVSDDGIIEAIFTPGFLGVQWHPERPLGQGKWRLDREAWSKLVQWHLAGFREERK